MVLMILAMLSLADLMSFIAVLIVRISSAPASAAVRVWVERSFALAASSELRRAIEDISSREALVSSRDAAWLPELSERTRLCSRRTPEADETLSAPRRRRSATEEMLRVVRRAIQKAATVPIRMVARETPRL